MSFGANAGAKHRHVIDFAEVSPRHVSSFDVQKLPGDDVDGEKKDQHNYHGPQVTDYYGSSSAANSCKTMSRIAIGSVGTTTRLCG